MTERLTLDDLFAPSTPPPPQSGSCKLEPSINRQPPIVAEPTRFQSISTTPPSIEINQSINNTPPRPPPGIAAVGPCKLELPSSTPASVEPSLQQQQQQQLHQQQLQQQQQQQQPPQQQQQQQQQQQPQRNGNFFCKAEPPQPAADAGYSWQTSLASATSSAAGALDPAAVEAYRDLILSHLMADIHKTCQKLFIANDPRAWSADDTALWLEDTCGQLQLDASPVNLYLPGHMLCAMGQHEFSARAPGCGETLHAQLQIWKTAVDFAASSSSNGAGNGGSPSLCQSTSQQVADASTNVADWLSSFDPGRQSPPQQPQPMQQQHQLLNSPSASDSGISADYDECQLEAAGALSHGRTPNRRHTTDGSGGGGGQHNVHLWQFLREVLDAPNEAVLRWIDRSQGIFKIENSHELARLWGVRKNRCKMNYDKLSRSLRQYYKKGIIRKTGQRQRLIYQFLAPYNCSV